MSIQEFTSYPAIKLARLLVTLENGSRPAGGVGLINEGVPSLGGEHITYNGKFDFENIKYVSEGFFARMSRGVIQKFDVLVVKDGATTGKTAFVDDNFPFTRAAINEHVFILRPATNLLLPEYLFYFLFSEWGQGQMEREFHGGAIGGINQSFAEHLEISLPPLSEQRRIVDILRLADNLQGWRNETVQKSKKLHANFFDWYFGNGTNSEDQESVKLKSILKIGLSSGYSPQTSDDLTGIPVFNLSALTDYGLDEQQLKYFPVKSYNGKGDDLITDDLLISRSNTLEYVGRVGRYKGLPSKVIYPDTMIRIRVGNHVDAIYLEHFLRSPYMRAVITQLARGTSGSMKKISQADINEFQILMPSKLKREKFALSIEFLEMQEAKYIVALQKSNELFQLISAIAFTGELTFSWREGRKDEIQRDAVERDKALGLQGKNARLIDYKTGKISPEDEEKFRSALKPLAEKIIVDLSNRDITRDILDQKSSFSQFAKMAENIADQRIVHEVLEKTISLAFPAASWFSDSSNLSQQKLAYATKTSLQTEKYEDTLAKKMYEIIARVLEETRQTQDFQSLELNPSQKKILQFQSVKDYFSAESLSEESNLTLEEARSTLELFKALGLVMEVSIADEANSTSEFTIFATTYRAVRSTDESRDDDLRALEPNLEEPNQ